MTSRHKPLGALSVKIGSNNTSWLEVIDAGLVSSSVIHANWQYRHFTGTERTSKEVQQVASLLQVFMGGSRFQKKSSPRKISNAGSRPGEFLRHGTHLRASYMLHLGHAGHEAEAIQGGLTENPDESGRTAKNHPFPRPSDPMSLACPSRNTTRPGASNKLPPTCWGQKH